MIARLTLGGAYHSFMQTAHPISLGAQLAHALAFWNRQLGLERGAAACSVSQPLPPGPVSGVLLARPELGRLGQDLLESRSTTGQPLPDMRILSDWVERAEWQLARTSRDCPRRSAARASELAEALRNASWIQRSFGESTRGLAEISHDWVELFLRWDWLVAGWRALGEPLPSLTPADGPSPLEGLETLVSVYEAHADSSDLPFWLLERGPLCPSRAGPLLLLGQGPLDPALLAAAAVLSGAQPQAHRLPLLGGATAESAPAVPPLQGPWALAWPELEELQRGLLPDPQGWPSPAERAQQARARYPEARARHSEARSNPVVLIEASQLEPAVDAALDAVAAAAAPGAVAVADAPGAPGVVGVVAFDRLMARRLTVRLLERGTALEDRSGWSLDTTAASAPLDGLLDLVQATVSPPALLHWLSLPMIQRALGIGVPQSAGLYRSLRELPTGARGLRSLPPELQARLQALRPLQQRASRKDGAAVPEWVELLERALDQLGLEPLLAEDAAGLLVLGCLRKLCAEHLGPDSAQTRLLWPEFRAVLMRSIAQARLPLQQPEARVRFLSLSEAAQQSRLRALILLGASEEQMLLNPPSPLLSRRQMDSALARQPEMVERALSLGHLVSVLERDVPVLCFAAPPQPGLSVRWASPWVRLRAVCPEAVEVRSLSRAGLTPAATPPPDRRPPDRRPPELRASLPSRVPVTALSVLAVCPLQFFWRTQLDLSAWRPVAEAEGPAEGGTWLHRVAEAVPRRLGEPNPPSTADEWRGFLLDTLHALLPVEETDLVFWTTLQQRLSSLAQWLAAPSLPLPLAAESLLEERLPLSQARLRGRADWVIPEGVIDLKTTRPEDLKKDIALKRLDLQLQAYAWMLDPRQAQSSAHTLAFLSVQAEEVVTLTTPSQPALVHKVDETLSRIQQGEPIRALEAQAGGQGCEHCPARGACRPEEWMT